MCLGIPGQITKTWTDPASDLPMARVDFGGVGKEVCLSLEPDAQVGDYVLVHVGFAISRIDEAEAQQTLELLAQMGELAEELGETT
ncbi:MAG: HypC/HybG/HupF family hydrogenase formation chaperone [Anaerolineae bacterium]|nr:HypC/HybG/HupF family hydrogenase formation chaperone [Anaerolineae bacterium]